MMARTIAQIRLRLRLEQFEAAERRLIADQISAGVEMACACAFFVAVFLVFGVGLK